MFDNDTYSNLFTKERKPLHAANKFHTLFCEGFAQNNVKVLAYSVLPVNRENCDKRFINILPKKSDGYKIEYPKFINFPLIKHIMLFMESFFKVLFSSLS